MTVFEKRTLKEKLEHIWQNWPCENPLHINIIKSKGNDLWIEQGPMIDPPHKMRRRNERRRKGR